MQPVLELWILELKENKFVLFYAITFVAISKNRSSKLIWLPKKDNLRINYCVENLKSKIYLWLCSWDYLFPLAWTTGPFLILIPFLLNSSIRIYCANCSSLMFHNSNITHKECSTQWNLDAYLIYWLYLFIFLVEYCNIHGKTVTAK
jgi:hypothetical protein